MWAFGVTCISKIKTRAIDYWGLQNISRLLLFSGYFNYILLVIIVHKVHEGRLSSLGYFWYFEYSWIFWLQYWLWRTLEFQYRQTLRFSAYLYADFLLQYFQILVQYLVFRLAGISWDERFDELRRGTFSPCPCRNFCSRCSRNVLVSLKRKYLPKISPNYIRGRLTNTRKEIIFICSA